jgi:tRNA-specific 2-thiouridylase
MRTKARVVVAMSGGVDSSVAAALLIEQGFEVVGITLRLLSARRPDAGGRRFGSCCSPADIEDARMVASQLGIPHYVLNHEREFDRLVVQDFAAAYMAGRTPNPCVLCNERVKFGSLLERALGLGAELVATGHYARVCRDGATGRYLLRRAHDTRKDQSYFLYTLTQWQLARVAFPLGGMTKEGVRERAASLGLAVAAKPDSQEICFVGGDYRSFLRERPGATFNPGAIKNTAGRTLGQHQGLALYTIGQRSGLGAAGDGPYYVVRMDAATNEIVVGKADELLCEEFVAEHVNLIAWERLSGTHPARAMVRYRQVPALADLAPLPNGRLHVRWREPQRLPAPGQAAVFYDHLDPDLVLGGASVAAWAPQKSGRPHGENWLDNGRSVGQA